jgi:hypothetical protein
VKRILLNSDGAIMYAFVDPADAKRPEPLEILNILKTMPHEK